jgi:hypothetical protein
VARKSHPIRRRPKNPKIVPSPSEWSGKRLAESSMPIRSTMALLPRPATGDHAGALEVLHRTPGGEISQQRIG